VRTNVLAFAVLITLVLSGCTHSGGDPVIDTWPVGAAAECPDVPTCDELVRVGLAGLAVRDPGHAPVVSTRLHVEGVFTDPATGHQILMTRSGGCCRVLVVELAGGSTRAIGVGYPGISTEAVAIPWETATGR
jgi:hypothetical protein